MFIYYTYHYCSPKALITITTGLEKFIANCGLLNASVSKTDNLDLTKRKNFSDQNLSRDYLLNVDLDFCRLF